MKKLLLQVAVLLSATLANAQLVSYKTAETNPNANYFTVVNQWRSQLQQEKAAFTLANPGRKLPEELREEIAQFERWAYQWKDKIGVDGKFPNSAQGWLNVLQQEPQLLKLTNTQNPGSLRTTDNLTWTSIGPLDSSLLNNWSYGAGIGRVNVVKRHPVQLNVLFAGTTAGGIFKSTNLGQNWQPLTDNLSGLGVSDIAIDPINPNIMYMASGDFDGNQIASIGVLKSTDGGNNWATTGLTFNLSQRERIAHVFINRGANNNTDTIFATAKDAIHRSIDGGNTWAEFFKQGTNFFFNDFIKIGNLWYASDKGGSIYRFNPAGTGINDNFSEIFSTGSNNRVDFAWTPANPDSLYLLRQTNPAFAKLNINTGMASAFKNVTNNVPADNNGNFNTQGGYNQVIAVSPTGKDSVWTGEFSGKVSTDGGNTWQNKLNGYYEPTGSANWGGFYVHSDNHFFEFLNSDSLIIGNDGGVYIGKVSTNDYKQRFNGLVATQSYTMAIDDAEPNNLIIGNQDNDGSSRVLTGSVAKFYAAQAGDGTATAISRNDNNTRYIGGTQGSLSYRTDGFKDGYSGNSINTPSGAPFSWDLQMHNTAGNIIYGGFADINKMTAAPTGSWTALGSGAATNVVSIALSNNDATTQKIVLIDGMNNVRKSANETSWSTITRPTGVIFNNIYAKKTNWDTLFATASGYDAANKVFLSADNGGTWINVTKNLPNIAMRRIIMYEGADSVFLATELGLFFARTSQLITNSAPWAKMGAGLPNVIVTDMEISYAKKQLFVSTFGRGVWMIDLFNPPLPLSAINFTYNSAANANQYNLVWNISDNENVKTVLETSTDGRNFTTVATFTDGLRNNQKGYGVSLTNGTAYYRIYYTTAAGKITYSLVVLIRKGGGANLVSIYPNPTNDYIKVSSQNKIASVIISRLNGQQLTYAKPQTNFYSFDMGLLPSGIYLVQVTDEKGKIQTEKIVRQ